MQFLIYLFIFPHNANSGKSILTSMFFLSLFLSFFCWKLLKMYLLVHACAVDSCGDPDVAVKQIIK